MDPGVLLEKLGPYLYLHTILEETPNGVVVIGLDHIIIHANPAASRFIGSPYGELAGKELEEILGDNNADLFLLIQDHCQSQKNKNGWKIRHEIEFSTVAENHILSAVVVFSPTSPKYYLLYLIEITQHILAHRDESGTSTVDLILDTAGQKGTGKWTVALALETGYPLTLIGEAVFARCLSALKEERVAASQLLSGPQAAFDGNNAAMIDDLEQALYASKLISYAQGYQLMRAVAAEQGWNLNYGGIALMWRGGCIIRSVFLGKIKEAFDRDRELANLMNTLDQRVGIGNYLLMLTSDHGSTPPVSYLHCPRRNRTWHLHPVTLAWRPHHRTSPLPMPWASTAMPSSVSRS